jgi:hypothetical protein
MRGSPTTKKRIPGAEEKLIFVNEIKNWEVVPMSKFHCFNPVA